MEGVFTLLADVVKVSAQWSSLVVGLVHGDVGLLGVLGGAAEGLFIRYTVKAVDLSVPVQNDVRRQHGRIHSPCLACLDPLLDTETAGAGRMTCIAVTVHPGTHGRVRDLPGWRPRHL